MYLDEAIVTCFIRATIKFHSFFTDEMFLEDLFVEKKQ